MTLFFQAFQDNEKLSSFFSLLSTNMAENGAHFVSTIEGYQNICAWNFQTKLIPLSWMVMAPPFVASILSGKRYPFYGVQWHPEVNRFQWDRRLNFPHTSHAVQLSSLLAEFFINEGKELLMILIIQWIITLKKILYSTEEFGKILAL